MKLWPVVTVETFSTVDEAINIGNDTEYGLAGPTGLEEYTEAKLVYENTAPAVTGWFEDRR